MFCFVCAYVYIYMYIFFLSLPPSLLILPPSTSGHSLPFLPPSSLTHLSLSSHNSSNNQCAIACSNRATSGYLYPLDKGFIFVHRPAVYIKFDAIVSVNFARMSGSAGISRSFDFELEMKDGNVIHFSSIMKWIPCCTLCMHTCMSVYIEVSQILYMYMHLFTRESVLILRQNTMLGPCFVHCCPTLIACHVQGGLHTTLRVCDWKEHSCKQQR